MDEGDERGSLRSRLIAAQRRSGAADMKPRSSVYGLETRRYEMGTEIAV
jgi:hypothetical protein